MRSRWPFPWTRSCEGAIRLEKDIRHRQVHDFAHTQARVQHEREDRAITHMVADGGEQLLQYLVGEVPRQRLSVRHVVPSRLNRIRQVTIQGIREVIEKHAELDHAAADGAGLPAQPALPIDELIDVMNGDCQGRNLAHPVKENRDVAGVVDGGAAVRLTSTPVAAKAFDFGLRKHNSPPCMAVNVVLPTFTFYHALR